VKRPNTARALGWLGSIKYHIQAGATWTRKLHDPVREKLWDQDFGLNSYAGLEIGFSSLLLFSEVRRWEAL